MILASPLSDEAKRRVTTVIPARDEAQGIVVTLEALSDLKARLGRDFEVIVVDDGSTDGTGAIAEQHGAIVVRHPHGGGYGRALKTGILHASSEMLVILDADGTYPLEELPAMLDLAEQHDMVVGARTGPHFRQFQLRSPAYATYLFLTNFVTGKKIPDPNSGFRVFRRSQVLPLLDQFPNGFSFTTTLTLVLTLTGRFVHYHPVFYRERIGSSKVRFLWDALRAGQGMLEVILRYNPVKAFLALSALPALAAVVTALSPIDAALRLAVAAGFVCTSLLTFALGMVAVAVSGARRIPRPNP